jgi:hypothetical protein
LCAFFVPNFLDFTAPTTVGFNLLSSKYSFWVHYYYYYYYYWTNSKEIYIFMLHQIV